MNTNQIKEVMKKYGKAWKNRDTELLLSLFTKNGTYQESPLSKPYRGHEELRKFWNKDVREDTKNIKFKLGKCYVSSDKKTGFAEWECKNYHRWREDGKWKNGHMVGIMLLKMKGDKISSLNEYWNVKTSQ